MATLRQKGGFYFIDYRVSGRRIRKNVGKTKRIAELALKDLEVKLIKGELGFDTKKETDLSHLFEEYNKYSTTHHSPGSQRRYKAIWDNFRAFISHYPYLTKISHLSPKIFMDYQNYRKKEEASNTTINMEITCLRTLFSLAMKWGYAKINPTNGVGLLKQEVNTSPEFLTEAQCKKILDKADDFMYPILFTLLNTGLRKGELENLEWKDVDFDRRKIKVQYKDDWSPKTAERQIPINDDLYVLLKKHKNEFASNCPFIFQRNGERIASNYLRKRFMLLTASCGFPELTKIHSLRHTFASHLVMKGVDLATVKQLLGHTDIDTTMIYSHLTEKHVDEAVDKLTFGSGA